MTKTGESVMLEVEGLEKSFGSVRAVNGVSFEVKPGECFALLGANGAGKTTTLRMLCGVLEPDAGTARIDGHDVREESQRAKAALAYMPDEPLLYDKLRPLEYLQFVSALWHMDTNKAAERSEQLLKEMGLWEKRDSFCEALSRGMRQKLALCGALVHEPKLLVLDEPLTGLDVKAAHEVKETLRSLLHSGCSILLTTHIVDIAEQLADRIAVIRTGSIIKTGTIEQLKSSSSHDDGKLESALMSLL